MMKKSVVMLCLGCFFSGFISVYNVFAFEKDNLELIEPALDMDFVVLQNKQSKTVTADLTFPLDFEIIPVTLIGSGNFSASFSRTNTSAEIAYIYLYVVSGFGTPITDLNFGVTPISLRVNTTISDDADLNLAMVLVTHGILFSLEDPPYEYSVSLSF